MFKQEFYFHLSQDFLWKMYLSQIPDTSPGRCLVMQSGKIDPAEHLVPFCFPFILGYAFRVDSMVEGAKRKAGEESTLCSDGDTRGPFYQHSDHPPAPPYKHT